MSKAEHRVNVDNGKYTFVVPGGDYRVSILRHGEPWHGPQAEACTALHSIMAELDAARVVLQAVRAYADAPAHEVPASITNALALYDRLVDDRQPPSEWCGTKYCGGSAADVAWTAR